MLRIPRPSALDASSADLRHAPSGTTRRAPAQPALGARRYLVACFGIVTTAAGVVLTVSALTLMALEKPVAEASGVAPEPVVYFSMVVTGEAPPVTAAAEAVVAQPAPEAGEGRPALPVELRRPISAETLRLPGIPPLRWQDAPLEPEDRGLEAASAKDAQIEALLEADAQESAIERVRRLHAFGLPQPEPAVTDETAASGAAAPPARVDPPAPSPPAAIIAEVQRIFPGLQVVRTFHNVNLTFYDCAEQGFCGNMANGRKVYQGAAACSYDLPFGTRFYIEGDPTGRIYRCEDRGLLANTWVDIFWYHPSDGWKWQEVVGRRGTIHIVEWGD